MQNRADTIALLKRRLTVSTESVQPYYYRWFALPWARVYTLNVDDLADAANRAFDLPRPLQAISALTDPAPPRGDSVQVIHLNGTLADLPGVTFGGRQYAERLATSDLWYANLARELVSYSFVFSGTTLDEPPMWQYIEARGTHGSGRELRPGSFLVTQSLTRARSASLRQYQISWLPHTAETFERDVLTRLDEAGARGLQALSRGLARDQTVVRDLDFALADSTGDEREFLLGREPRWSDLTDGFAVERAIDRVLLADIESEDPRLVVITGTAGSGKSAIAMRLTLALRATGAKAIQLNLAADRRGFKIRRDVEAAGADVLLIDDLDQLGRSGVGVLEDLRAACPYLRVVAALRSPRYEGLGVADHVAGRDDAMEVVAPVLSDDDIDAVLDSLTRANRLGALKGLPRTQQQRMMAAHAGRQLLVAMIEATSGQRFMAKIESECRDLGPEAALVYGVVALAGNFRITLRNEDVLAALGGDIVEQMRILDGLLRTHLLVKDKHGRISLRHKVIAERAVEFFRSAGLVETPLRGLVFAMAAASRPGYLRDTAQGRATIRLINHQVLIEFLRTADGAVDQVGIRGIYDEIEGLLAPDFHFWLQRGSFETEQGDLDLAKNFIEQARSIAGEDPYVRTQWAYMTLKRASRRPKDPAASEQVAAAFEELDEAIASRGRQDFYPFHVYGSQGLAWVNRSDLSQSEKAQLLQLLRGVVTDGLKLHNGNRELGQLARDLEAAYLKLAT